MKLGWSAALAVAAMAQLLLAPANAVDFSDLDDIAKNEEHLNGVVFPPRVDEATPAVLLAPSVEAEANGNGAATRTVTTEESTPAPAPVTPTPPQADNRDGDDHDDAATGEMKSLTLVDEFGFPVTLPPTEPSLESPSSLMRTPASLAPSPTTPAPPAPALATDSDDDDDTVTKEMKGLTIVDEFGLPLTLPPKAKLHLPSILDPTPKSAPNPKPESPSTKELAPSPKKEPVPSPKPPAPKPKEKKAMEDDEEDEVAGDYEDEVGEDAGARTILPPPLKRKRNLTPAPVLKNNQPWKQAAGADAQPVVSNGGVNLFPYTDDIRNYIVEQHNFARATMVPQEASNMRKMSWNEELAIEAAELVNTCVFSHDTENYAYGQNLMYGNPVIDRGTVESWMEAWVVNEISPSDRAGNGFMDLDHASAVLWANSYYVGCASKMCPNGYLTACNYFSPGNWEGEPVFIPGQACSACPSQAPYCDRQYGKLCTANPNETPQTPIQRPPAPAPAPKPPVAPPSANQRPPAPAQAPAPAVPPPAPVPAPAANGKNGAGGAGKPGAPGAGGAAGAAGTAGAGGAGGAAGAAGAAGAGGAAGAAGAGGAGGAGGTAGKPGDGPASASTKTNTSGSKSSGSSSGSGGVSAGPAGATVPSPSPKSSGGDPKQGSPGAVSANQKSGATTSTGATLSVVATTLVLVVVNVW